jgi:hypothetical protein
LPTVTIAEVLRSQSRSADNIAEVGSGLKVKGDNKAVLAQLERLPFCSSRSGGMGTVMRWPWSFTIEEELCSAGSI